MDSSESSSGEESGGSWIEWFQGLRGNELFCVIDDEYINDRFNLTGLNTQVKHFALAYDLITDRMAQDLDAEMWDQVEKSARHLYGLIHARYVLSVKGLTKVIEKYRVNDYGKCPRLLCSNQNCLPVGITDQPGSKCVKLYCPKCEDVYNPSAKKHLTIDGAYFTTTLPHLLLLMFPDVIPAKSTERYTPSIFGFKIQSIAQEHKEQDDVRRQIKLSQKAHEE